MRVVLNIAAKTVFAAALIVAVLGTLALAAPPERVYIACDDHTDYYWSGDGATYRRAFLEMIDYYLARADATDGQPPDYQARFNCDGSLWMWEYERNKSAADFHRLIRRIKDGHISVPLTPIPLCYGGMPAERRPAGDVLRRTDPAARTACNCPRPTPWKTRPCPTALGRCLPGPAQVLLDGNMRVAPPAYTTTPPRGPTKSTGGPAWTAGNC